MTRQTQIQTCRKHTVGYSTTLPYKRIYVKRRIPNHILFVPFLPHNHYIASVKRNRRLHQDGERFKELHDINIPQKSCCYPDNACRHTNTVVSEYTSYNTHNHHQDYCNVLMMKLSIIFRTQSHHEHILQSDDSYTPLPASHLFSPRKTMYRNLFCNLPVHRRWSA